LRAGVADLPLTLPKVATHITLRFRIARESDNSLNRHALQVVQPLARAFPESVKGVMNGGLVGSLFRESVQAFDDLRQAAAADSGYGEDLAASQTGY
jgi:hypothetical protein